jgi:hypothetical protein
MVPTEKSVAELVSAPFFFSAPNSKSKIYNAGGINKRRASSQPLSGKSEDVAALQLKEGPTFF